MGYPMTYPRVISRNNVYEGGYENTTMGLQNFRGDLRRLEQNTQDDAHIKAYAKISGATEDQVRTIFAYFFNYNGSSYAVPFWEFRTREGEPEKPLYECEYGFPMKD